MKTLHRRLDHLEQVAADLAQRHAAAAPWPTDEDLALGYAEAGDAGEYDREPDFERALDLYADAIVAAREQAEPPWDPPADFLPTYPQDLRLLHWRGNPTRFPAVNEARAWLSEMIARKEAGIPPMSESEFADLVAWFEANYPRLREAAGPDTLLKVAEGKKESLANLRYAIRQGPRRHGAGTLAQRLRWLRHRHG